MSAQDTIREQVTSHKVVLYMKGTPQFPQCGFSASATQILKSCGVTEPFTVNVLADHPATLHERRVGWRLRHHARDVPERRVAKTAGLTSLHPIKNAAKLRFLLANTKSMRHLREYPIRSRQCGLQFHGTMRSGHKPGLEG